MGHDVFISHSTKDKVAADAVCAALEANGVRCWIAPRNINTGGKWATSILKGIAESRLMVLVFSEHANGSEHIQREVERAVHRGVAIAPLRISDAMPKDDLEYFLSSSHWMDALTPPLEKHLREFHAAGARALLEMRGQRAGKPPELSAAVAERPAPALPRRSRVPVLLWLTVVLAGIAAAAWAFHGNLASRFAEATHDEPTTAVSPSAPGAVPAPMPAVAVHKLDGARKAVEGVTVRALTANDFKDVASYFTSAQQDRVVKTKPDTKDLDDQIDAFNTAWKTKYGYAFKIKDLNVDYPDAFAHFGQDSADGTKATGIITSHGASGITIPFVQEGGLWKINVPNSVDGQVLHDNLLAAINALNKAAPTWPDSDVEAAQAVTYSILGAVMNQK